MGERWSAERAWEWYNSRPWLRGCNYMSADCANRIDQWQELGFEERLKTTEAELALMQKTGYNSVRLIIEYEVWRSEHDGFLKRFERYISLCASYGISCMIVLANDCMPPMSDTWKRPYIGEQQYDHGYHGGKKSSQHGIHSEPAPHFYLDDPDTADDYFKMVTEIVSLYKNDGRICMWDLYNEPGASMRWEVSKPLLARMFETVRAIDPIQPLTVGVFRVSPDRDVPMYDIERYALDNVDIVTYHCYGKFSDQVGIINRLRAEGRPIMNTEWLGRCLGNSVFDCFPLFYLERIGCYNWGFVAGKYQTFEPWEGTWTQYYNGEIDDRDVDFTKWFHDLYRPNHRPYDPREIDLIKHFCDEADKDFATKK